MYFFPAKRKKLKKEKTTQFWEDENCLKIFFKFWRSWAPTLLQRKLQRDNFFLEKVNVQLGFKILHGPSVNLSSPVHSAKHAFLNSLLEKVPTAQTGFLVAEQWPPEIKANKIEICLDFRACYSFQCMDPKNKILPEKVPSLSKVTVRNFWYPLHRARHSFWNGLWPDAQTGS